MKTASIPYQPTHWLFGALMALMVMLEFNNAQPQGFYFGIAGELAVGLAILTSRFIPWRWRLILLVATLLPMLSPVVFGYDRAQPVVWLMVALGAGLLSVNLFRGAPDIPDRGLTAFVTSVVVGGIGIMAVLQLSWVFTDIRWLVVLFVGPLAAWIFGILTTRKETGHETSH